MTSQEEFLHLYRMESEALSMGISVNIDELTNNMPQIYSEDVFNKMIDTIIPKINNLKQDLENEVKYIVGDVHGSVVQLFSPLVKAGIIKNLRYSHDEDKFEFDFCNSSNISRNTRIIYTGDIIYRGIHAHLMAMIESLIIIIQRFNYKIVNWVFGNHDMEFVKYSGIPRYTLNEYKNACPRFDEIHLLFTEFALRNPYKFGYILDLKYDKSKLNNENENHKMKLNHEKLKSKLSKSHDESKLNNENENHESKSKLNNENENRKTKLNHEELKSRLSKLKSTKILISHTIQSSNDIIRFTSIYNQIFKSSINSHNLMNSVDLINECFNNIVKLMINDNEKYFNPKSEYSKLLNFTLWRRPGLNIDYVDYGCQYHVIGHTPIDNVQYITTRNRHTIISVDLNTFNNEQCDECAWIKIENSESEIEDIEIEIDDLELNSLETHNLSFTDFNVKVEYNMIKYPENMLSQDDIKRINKGVHLYNKIIDNIEYTF